MGKNTELNLPTSSGRFLQDLSFGAEGRNISSTLESGDKKQIGKEGDKQQAESGIVCLGNSSAS